MSKITTNYDAATETVNINMQVDFDYNVLNEFKTAFQTAAKHYVLDMSEVHYIDSSALGMLLNLRDHAFAINADVSIINMNDIVLEIFRVLNFHKIFKPEYNKANFRVVWVAKPEA